METSHHDFTVDNNIINHLIKNQSSDLHDAILELIQNSFDAEATECELTILPIDCSDTEDIKLGKVFDLKNKEGFYEDILNEKPNGIYILVQDNGTGFNSKEDIIQKFGSFGSDRELLNNKFGRFRMGRAQIMNHSEELSWYSDKYHVEVTNTNGKYAYSITEMDNVNIPGCFVEMKIPNSNNKTIKSYIESIENRCKFFRNINITINNRNINDIKYDKNDILFEDENFILLKKSEIEYRSWKKLYVYNLGRFVCSYSKETFGIEGNLITKKALELNTSRNLIIESDYWNDCKNTFKKIYLEGIKKKSNLKKESSSRLLALLSSGEISLDEIAHIRLFKLIKTDNVFTFNQLSTQKKAIYFCDNSELKTVKLDKLIQTNRAIIINNEIFNYNDGVYVYQNDPKEYFERLYDATENTVFENILDNIIDDYDFLIDESNVILKDDDLKIEHLVLLKTLRSTFKAISVSLGNVNRKNIKRFKMNRKIYLGSSIENLGWTDGETYIAINSTYYKKTPSLAWVNGIINTLIHEICHNSKETNLHGEEFYRNFHDIINLDNGYFITNTVKHFIRYYTHFNEKYNNKIISIEIFNKPLRQKEIIITEKEKLFAATLLLKSNILKLNYDEIHSRLNVLLLDKWKTHKSRVYISWDLIYFKSTLRNVLSTKNYNLMECYKLLKSIERTENKIIKEELNLLLNINNQKYDEVEHLTSTLSNFNKLSPYKDKHKLLVSENPIKDYTKYWNYLLNESKKYNKSEIDYYKDLARPLYSIIVSDMRNNKKEFFNRFNYPLNSKEIFTYYYINQYFKDALSNLYLLQNNDDNEKLSCIFNYTNTILPSQ